MPNHLSEVNDYDSPYAAIDQQLVMFSERDADCFDNFGIDDIEAIPD